MSAPHTANRSVTSTRCGDRYRPVVSSCAQATAAAARAAVDFPFVPVTWIVG